MSTPLAYGSQADKWSKPTKSVDTGGWGFNDAESCIMRRINDIRKRNGLTALEWDRQVGYVARKHANTMASARGVFHDGNMDREITRWRSLGQNTGRANGCVSVMRAFMNSSAHRANILGPWKHMGVGVERRHGCIWVQQVFESREDPGNVYHYPG